MDVSDNLWVTLHHQDYFIRWVILLLQLTSQSRNTLFIRNRACCTGLSHSISQRKSILHHWLKSYGDFAEWVELVELHQEGFAPAACQRLFTFVDTIKQMINICYFIPLISLSSINYYVLWFNNTKYSFKN